MRAIRASLISLAALALLLNAGCHNGSRSDVALSDAPLVTENGAQVVEASPVRTATFVDRHPLFWKPREYYDSTNSGTVGKTAAATFVGVPTGIYGELRQIIVGIPPAGRAY